MTVHHRCLLFMLTTGLACGEDDGDANDTNADGTTANATNADSTGADMQTGSPSTTVGNPTADTGDPGSAGCGQDPTGIAQTLQVGAQARTFELYLPPGYDPDRAYPLVFGFHGGGGTGAGSQGYWGLDQAVGSDAIVVYPDGLPEFEGGDTVWLLDPAGEGFVFFDDLLAHLEANLCVDRSRVFATGWSMGGFMTNSLGCYRSDVLTAIASVSGGVAGPKPPEPPYPECVAEIPAMVIHGASDSVIPAALGEEMRDVFVANNGCATTSATTSPAPCVAYDDCSSATLWCEFAGDHIWPDFAGAGVWAFFSAQ